MVKAAVPVGLVFVALLAGCGGGGKSGSSSTSTESAADWATSYCGAASDWVAALQSARDSLKNNNGSTNPQDAVQSVSLATNTFTIALHKLPAPSTPNGEEAEKIATNLGSLVQGRVARASAAASTNNSSVSAAQQTAVVRNQATLSIEAIASSTTQIENTSPQLKAAMKTSSDCQTLNAELAKEKG